MSNTNKIEQASSRRQFLYQGSLASMGLLLMGKSAMAANSLAFLSSQPNSLINGVQVGAITYSFRSLPGTAEQKCTIRQG